MSQKHLNLYLSQEEPSISTISSWFRVIFHSINETGTKKIVDFPCEYQSDIISAAWSALIKDYTEQSQHNITRTELELSYLLKECYQISSCLACRLDEPGQLAHCQPGGCMSDSL